MEQHAKKDYENRDGKRAWLSETEMEQLINKFDDTERCIVCNLGRYCGTRREEIVGINAVNLVESQSGTYHLRV